MVERMKANPLARALRCDKLCLSALEATLRIYLNPDAAWQRIPTLRMIARSQAELSRAARSLAGRLRRALSAEGLACAIALKTDVSRVGGGAFPQCDLPTTLVCLKPAKCGAAAFKHALLRTEPPLLGRLENDCFCLDPRTLEAGQHTAVTRAIVQALSLLS